jgi:hypothetical protein
MCFAEDDAKVRAVYARVRPDAYVRRNVLVANLADFEVRTAAEIHPNAAPVVAPAAAEDAVRITALADQADSALRVDRAVAASHVVGGTVDDLDAVAGLPAAAIVSSSSANPEIRAVAAVHPDPAIVVTPRAAELTGGATELADHLHAAARVCGVDVAPTVIRGAINAVAVVSGAPAEAGGLEVAAAAMVHPNPTSANETPGTVENARRIAALPYQLPPRTSAAQ